MSLRHLSHPSSSSASSPHIRRSGLHPTNSNDLSLSNSNPLFLSSLPDTYDTNPPPKHHLSSSTSSYRFTYILPVLLLEFLALSLTRAVLPGLLVQQFDNVYIVMGYVEGVRGLLAFLTSPIVGQLSDGVLGRKGCLFVTVGGTCAPVCALALLFRDTIPSVSLSEGYTRVLDEVVESNSAGSGGFWGKLIQPVLEMPAGDISATTEPLRELHPHAMTIFIILLALSGLFASTFTLVFAYISDTVSNQDDRVAAYGLALATFGLSFTLGPMMGGYLAQVQQEYVFRLSLVLAIVDLLYIYFVLPESRQLVDSTKQQSLWSSLQVSWNPLHTFRLLANDTFLRHVAQVAFFYYTGFWAVVSTLSVYAVQHFSLSPQVLGELMSALGLCTMVAEAVLVRLVVPMVGEKRAVQTGLLSFALQCVVLGFANEVWHLFLFCAFSLLANLVYPSLSSLVSGNVEPAAVGEALGAVNGIKALTEGLGPLIFGSLMTLSSDSFLPGWPYLIAAILVLLAFQSARLLPDTEDEDYVHELTLIKRRKDQSIDGGILMRTFGEEENNYDEEAEGLLSEVDENEPDELHATN